MGMKHNYENISKSLNEKINEKIERLEKFYNLITDKERQYAFIVFLQTLPIEEKDVFDIYTNTNLESKNNS